MQIDLTDAELVERIASGTDQEAETELFRRMAPRVRLYGLRHLRDHASAEDLMQQVLITTLEALRRGSLRDPEKLTSFVLGTCRMTVLNVRRGAHRRAELLAQFGSSLPTSVEPAHPEVDLDRLASCVQALRERERSVVVMTFYDEKAGEEIVEWLGISAENLRVIRHRAIRQLRECMGAAA